MHWVVLEQIITSNYPPVVRDAAIKLADATYTDVGTFLSELSTQDLHELMGYCNRIAVKTDMDFEYDSIVILGEMLAQAEGVVLEDMSVERSANLIILLNFEDMARRGIIDFNREKATLAGELPPDIAKIK